MPLTRKPPASAASVAPTDPLKMLQSDDQEKRWAAARAAANLPGGANALANALRSETDARVREAMLTSLTRMRSTESVHALVPLLKADSAALRTGALDALRAMADIVREYLPKLLADSDTDVRILSCELARCLPSDIATPILCKLLASESEPNVCAAAIDVLAEAGSGAALPALADCAQRFATLPFMTFAIQIATERIRIQTSPPHPASRP